MELTISAEVGAMLERELQVGEYDSPSELIEVALHLLADSRVLDLKDLDAKIQQGLDDIDRGDVFSEEEARTYLKTMRAKL